MVKIVPDKTRFTIGKLNYCVKSKAADAPEVGDMWHVSESSIGGFIGWPKSGRRYGPKIIIKSGDDIRQALIECRAEDGVQSLRTTGGRILGQTAAGKKLVVRGGKALIRPNLANIHAAMLRIQQSHPIRSVTP